MLVRTQCRLGPCLGLCVFLFVSASVCLCVYVRACLDASVDVTCDVGCKHSPGSRFLVPRSIGCLHANPDDLPSKSSTNQTLACPSDDIRPWRRHMTESGTTEVIYSVSIGSKATNHTERGRYKGVPMETRATCVTIVFIAHYLQYGTSNSSRESSVWGL